MVLVPFAHPKGTNKSKLTQNIALSASKL